MYCKKVKKEKCLQEGSAIVRGDLNLANNFNQFFASIGEKIANRFPFNKQDVTTNIMQANMNSFFIAPVTEHELDTIIRNMNNKTSVDVYNISMKFIKEIRHCILSQLCKLINIFYKWSFS